jgi:hypothetical protein
MVLASSFAAQFFLLTSIFFRFSSLSFLFQHIFLCFDFIPFILDHTLVLIISLVFLEFLQNRVLIEVVVENNADNFFFLKFG